MKYGLIIFPFFLIFLRRNNHRGITPAPQADTDNKVCLLSKKVSEAATLIAQTQNYQQAVISLKKAALSSHKEHVVAFAKDTAGKIIHTAPAAGNANSGFIPHIAGRFADMHIHTAERPPSSGDIYDFIDRIMVDSSYIRYIITPHGQAYALVLIDKKTALSFNTSFPRRPGIKSVQPDGSFIYYQPTFPQRLVDEFNEIRSWNAASEEIAIVWLLKKYHAGIALLKQQASGCYSALDATEKIDTRGKVNYYLFHCP